MVSTARPDDPGADRWVLAAAILASSMAFIDGSALNVALPVLQQDLSATGTDLLWIVNAYALILSALILTGGALGDRYGRRRIFMAGIALFVAASAACGAAPTVRLLILGRAVQGTGAALMVPGSLALIAGHFPAGRRGGAIGSWSAASTGTTLLGPLLGGFLAGAGLWRAIFYVNIPLGLIALAVLWWRVPEQPVRRGGPPDVAGALLVTGGLALLSYGFIQGAERPMTSPDLFAALVVAVAVLGLFVRVEQRAALPMLPLRVFRNRLFRGANLLTLLLYGALSGAFFFLTLNLVQIQGYSPEQTGLAILPMVLPITLLSRTSGRLTDRWGPRPFLIAGPLLVTGGMAALAIPGVTRGPAEFWTTFFPGMLAVGVGMGLVVSPLSSSVMGALPPEDAGTASGVNNAVSRLAGVLGVALLGALALNLFASSLLNDAAALDLSPTALDALRSEARQFGAALPPRFLSPPVQAAVERAIDLAFVRAYRTVLLLSAAAAGLSALLAWRTLPAAGGAD